MKLSGMSLHSSEAFNPPSLGGGGESFDSKGELNAWSRQDAINQLGNVLSFLTANPEGRVSRSGKNLTAAQRQEYFNAVRTALESG
jgi:hypothetical protein